MKNRWKIDGDRITFEGTSFEGAFATEENDPLTGWSRSQFGDDRNVKLRDKLRKALDANRTPNPNQGRSGLRAYHDHQSASKVQAARYAEVMGREWSDPSPKAEDFGGPVYPAYPDSANEWTGKKRAKAEHEAAMVVYWAEHDAYTRANEAWITTDGYTRYLAALDAHRERQAQFGYTGKRKGDKELLAAAITMQEALPLAA